MVRGTVWFSSISRCGLLPIILPDLLPACQIWSLLESIHNQAISLNATYFDSGTNIGKAGVLLLFQKAQAVILARFIEQTRWY